MRVILNESKLADKEIELFFDEEKVQHYLFKKSKDKTIKYPWDTRAPRVYKYNDQFIKVYGLKRWYHFFTGHRYALLVKKSHEYLTTLGIKTITPNIYSVKGKYSIVGTKDIKNLGLNLLSDADPLTIRDSLIKIHNSLGTLDRYHGDNKPDNSAMNIKSKEVYLLDIDSIRSYPFFGMFKSKMKRKTLASLNRKVQILNNKLEIR